MKTLKERVIALCNEREDKTIEAGRFTITDYEGDLDVQIGTESLNWKNMSKWERWELEGEIDKLEKDREVE